MNEVARAVNHQRFSALIHQLSGYQTFQILTLSLASLIFSLGKITVYIAGSRDIFVYSAAAIAISQTVVVVTLSILGKRIVRTPEVNLRFSQVVLVILFMSFVGSLLFEAILFSWNLEPIEQSLFQRAISLMFATSMYLGFGWLAFVLSENFRDVKMAQELLANLSKKQFETTRVIRDARTYAVREISLEIEATRGSLENFVTTNSPTTDIVFEISKLQDTVNEVEIRISQISSRYPGSNRMPRIFSRAKYSLATIITAGIKQNNLFPGLISVVAFFGFSSWLSYFLEDVYAAGLAILLSFISFGIFWGYEKSVIPIFNTFPVWVRVFVYETFILIYLVLWLGIFGFFAGDNTESYGAAFVYAVIPFIFFNVGTFVSGIIVSSQEHRERLTVQAVALRNDLSELDFIRSDEDKIWKSLFSGDIALSPTTASVILRDATLSKDLDRIARAIPNVTKLWSKVLFNLPALS